MMQSRLLSHYRIQLMIAFTRWVCPVALLVTAITAGAAEEPGSLDDAALNERARLVSAHVEPDAAVLGALWASMPCDQFESPGKRSTCDRVLLNGLVERALAQPPEDPMQLRIAIDYLPHWLRNDPLRWPAERQRLLTLLQAREPEVVNNWLRALPPVVTPERRAEAALVLAHAARSTRTAPDFVESFRWIAERLQGLPFHSQAVDQSDDPDYSRRSEALSMSLAVALPGYQAFTHWCRDPGNGLANDCRASARVLAKGDTLLDRSVGAKLLQRLATTEAERAEAEATDASAQWLLQAARSCRPDNDRAKIALMETQGASEIELIEAALLARGLSIEPPADPALRADPCGQLAESAADEALELVSP